MSRDYMLELLDSPRFADANGGADLEIPIFEAVLAFCILRRDQRFRENNHACKGNRVIRIQPGMCCAIRDRFASRTESHSPVSTVRIFPAQPPAFLHYARAQCGIADGRISRAQFSRLRPRLSF